ncbi:hypothetical protein GCM10023205_75670 [Yinghuangia aomiensis]|uniref:Uncharacterized protein n=1 Tax=Yinghuangia aomiensis TaxID=676205 RepID=A0ABP9IAA6_9ACTN
MEDPRFVPTRAAGTRGVRVGPGESSSSDGSCVPDRTVGVGTGPPPDSAFPASNGDASSRSATGSSPIRNTGAAPNTRLP